MLITHVTQAVTDTNRLTTITYTYDPNYGTPVAGQAIRITGFVTHPEYNLPSAVVNTVSTNTFTVLRNGFTNIATETTSNGLVSSFIDVVTVSGPTYNVNGTTTERVGDSFSYSIIGRDYLPPSSGVPVDSVYSPIPGVPTITGTSFQFQTPIVGSQVIHSGDVFSSYPFAAKTYVSFLLPMLTGLYPNSPYGSPQQSVEFGATTGAVFSVGLDYGGNHILFVNGSQSLSYIPGSYYLTINSFNNISTVVQYTVSSAAYDPNNPNNNLIDRNNVSWNGNNGLFVYVKAYAGLTGALPFTIQNFLGASMTFSTNDTSQAVSGYVPNTTTITLATPFAGTSSNVFPGWQTINISGSALYSMADLSNHPPAVILSSDFSGASQLSFTFDGGINNVNISKPSAGSSNVYTLTAQRYTTQTVPSNTSFSNFTAYASSPDGTSTLQTQLAFSATVSYSNNFGTPTVQINGITIYSGLSLTSNTYLVNPTYFSNNTTLGSLLGYNISPPYAIYSFSPAPITTFTNVSTVFKCFANAQNVTQGQFVMTGNSTNGTSGGQVRIQTYPATQNYQPLPLNIFMDATSPAYSLMNSFLSSNGTSNAFLSSSNGIRVSQPTPLALSFYGVYSVGAVEYVTTNIVVPPVTITLTPDAASPTFQLLRYQPFAYQYAINGYNTDITLQLDSSSSNISNFTTSPTTTTATFSDIIGFPSILQNQPVVFNALLDSNVVGTISNGLNVNDFIIQANPSIPGYTLQLYKYEPFSNAFLIASPTSLILKSTGTSPEVLPFITPSVPSTDLAFYSIAGYQTSYSSSLILSVNAYTTSNSNVSNVTISVPVGPGRFYNPLSNTTYTFYAAENVSVTYPTATDIQFVTYLSLDTIPTASPALPSGLSFTTINSNTFQLQGTPNVQTSRQNYLVIGSNTTNGKIVTTKVSMQVKPPRILINGGPSLITGMLPNTVLSPSVFTATIPVTAQTPSNFYYNWNTNLPDGLFFQDINGSNVSPGTFSMFPPDASRTIVIAGTPTLAAATNLVTSGLSNYTISLVGNTRVPVLNSPVQTIQLLFGELVLFTGTTIPPLYATNPLTSNTLIFKAASYFPSTSPIVSITATNLPPGLSLTTNGMPNYVNGIDYAMGLYVSGTPTVANLTPNPTVVTASNANGKTRTNSVVIPILADVVTFDSSTPVENTSFTFIVSRPVSSDYPSGIKFTAISAAGKPITSVISFPDVAPFGLTLGSDGTISGIPTSQIPITFFEIVATDSLGTAGSRNIYITIQPDVYTFNSLTLNFVQNKAITPVQVLATTSGGRQVQFYGSTNLPSGLSLSPTGLLSGTPLGSGSGTFDVTASTGYDTGSTTYSFTILSDSILTLLTVSPLTVPVGPFSVEAFRSATYSGFDAPTSYVTGSVFPANITLSMTNNVLSGNLTGGSGSYTFTVRGTYQNVTADTTVSLTIANGVGLFTIGTSGSLAFTSPTTTRFSGLQYVPIQPIQVQATGGVGFVYYYVLTGALPRGLSVTPDPTGVYATVTGIPAVYSPGGSSMVIYAKNGSSVTSITLTFVITTPFFVEPTTAAAYTALLRNTVEENAAHNSEDNKVFPQSDALRGPLQAPPAPDEVVDRKCKSC